VLGCSANTLTCYGVQHRSMLLYWLWNRHIEQYADLRYVLRVLYSILA
jgi:hypothetical protein